MKYTQSILVILILNFVNENYSSERRSGIMTRTQLCMQGEFEYKKRMREYRKDKKHSGVRTILEYVPMCAVGTGLFLNSLYRMHNFEDKCWVQPAPTITPDMCDLLKQFVCGAALCTASSGCFGDGCNDLCESKMCNEDNCCSECCTICMQECCWLLGMNRNT